MSITIMKITKNKVIYTCCNCKKGGIIFDRKYFERNLDSKFSFTCICGQKFTYLGETIRERHYPLGAPPIPKIPQPENVYNNIGV
jgi:hypothetical protein